MRIANDLDYYALAWRSPTGDWFYIQTAPQNWRRWVGPFPTMASMEVDARDKVDKNVEIIITKFGKDVAL